MKCCFAATTCNGCTVATKTMTARPLLRSLFFFGWLRLMAFEIPSAPILAHFLLSLKSFNWAVISLNSEIWFRLYTVQPKKTAVQTIGDSGMKIMQKSYVHVSKIFKLFYFRNQRIYYLVIPCSKAVLHRTLQVAKSPKSAS